MFFVAVGLDNELKPLPFSVAAGSYFFRLQFSFHTASCSAFIFWLQFSVDNLALCVFKTSFQNHTWFCSVHFLLWQFLVDSVSLFCAGNFCVGTQ